MCRFFFLRKTTANSHKKTEKEKKHIATKTRQRSKGNQPLTSNGPQQSNSQRQPTPKKQRATPMEKQDGRHIIARLQKS
jgi:hypothetical protein